jgi:hypothetical protein
MSVLGVLWRRIKEHPLSRVGPGLITGVADDDPSGIATYSQAGAQFGLNMLWTMPLAFPLMAAIQLMCADIGRVTGKGIAANIKAAFPLSILRGVVERGRRLGRRGDAKVASQSRSPPARKRHPHPQTAPQQPLLLSPPLRF